LTDGETDDELATDDFAVEELGRVVLVELVVASALISVVRIKAVTTAAPIPIILFRLNIANFS
jgi:hypothetical protein